jgi:hypothetical protein
MIVVMEEDATDDQIVAVVDRLVQLGFDIHRSTGARYTILGAVGSRLADLRALELLSRRQQSRSGQQSLQARGACLPSRRNANRIGVEIF